MFLQDAATPLHHAASSGNHKVIKLLLDKRCDINAKDDVS